MKSLVELPDEKIVERLSTPPEKRSKTQMKLKIPNLDLEKVAAVAAVPTENSSRLDILAYSDRKKIELLQKRKQDLEMAGCTFMPKTLRNGKLGTHSKPE